MDLPIVPLGQKIAQQAYDKRIEAEAEQRRQSHEEWMREQLDPTIRLMKAVKELTQRVEMLELEQARQRLNEQNRIGGEG